MNDNELKPCPFCGSTKLKIDCKSVVVGWRGIDARIKNRAYSVRCNVCHARGGTVSGDVITSRLSEYRDRMPEWATTDDKLKERAAEAWNLRNE